MKTKDKILYRALELFNEYGVTEISSRNISDDLGISYGNLTYHFPKKEDIILSLYENMQSELNEQFQNLERQIFALDFMIGNLKTLFQILYKYRFLYLGLTKITRQYDSIRKDLIEQFESRRRILKNLAKFLHANGFLKPELVQGEYDSRIHNLLMIINLWIIDVELFYQGTEENKVDYYLEVFYHTLRPSLTEEGLKIFDEAYISGR